jgi:hypothetical protein
MLVDDNDVSAFVDDPGVVAWVDDNGLMLGGRTFVINLV